MSTLPRQLRVRSRMSDILLFGCVLALVTLTAPHEARAQATSSLTVTKIIAPDHWGPALWTTPSQSFPMTITCSNDPNSPYHLPVPVIVTNSNAPNTGSAVQSGIPVNSTCTVVEDVSGLPTLPPAPAGGAYCIPGSTLTWVAPQYKPTNGSVTIGAGTNAVTVYNQYSCRNPNTGLEHIDYFTQVYKQVANPSGVTWPPTTQFNFQVDCKIGGTHTSSITGVDVLANLTIPGWAGGGYLPQTPCMYSETSIVPPTFPWQNQTCTWNPMAPVFIDIRPTPGGVTYVGPINWGPPYGTVNGTIGNIQDPINLVNSFTCTPPATGTLNIKKEVVNNTGGTMPTGLTYPVTVTGCTTQPPLILQDGQSLPVPNIAFNTGCTITEALPPPPQICPAGLVPVWSTAYAPSSAVTVTSANSPVNVTVTNTLGCDKGPSGSLDVTKLLAPDPLNLASSLTPFSMVVTCTTPSGAVVPQTISMGIGGQSAVQGLPVGTICTSIQETVLPALPNGCAWSPPQFSTTLPITINPGSNNVAVTNSYICTGVLNVTKQVVVPGNAVLPFPSSSTPFSVTTNCGTLQPLFNNGPAQTVSNIPFNTSCLLAESLVASPPKICPAGFVPVWVSTTYAPSNPVTVTSANSPVNVVVKNTMDCVKAGSLTLRKSIYPDPLNIASTPHSFTFQVTCTTPPPANQPLNQNVSAGVGNLGTISGLPLGTKCTAIQEILTPPLPSGCTWNQPTFATLPITIGIGQNLVAVANSYTCVGASLQVTKSVSPDPLGLAMQFPIKVTCGSNTYNQTIASNNSGPPITGLTAFTPPCSVTETPPTLPKGCKWLPPVFTPAQTIPLAMGANAVTIKNGYTCYAWLEVTKSVNPDPRGIQNSLIFPIKATCGSQIQYSTVSVSAVGSIGNLSSGNTCTVTETLPALPKGCSWLAPQFSPGPTIAIVPGANPVTIQNGYTCAFLAQPQACPPPMDAGAVPGSCVCPPGTVRKGNDCAAQSDNCPAGTVRRAGRCVPRLVCIEPARLNRDATACVCPSNMAMKGNTCIPRDRRPPDLRDRIPRIDIPGLGGPRGGQDIGGPRGGQDSGGPRGGQDSGGLPGRR